MSTYDGNQKQNKNASDIIFRKDRTKIYEGEFKDGVFDGYGKVYGPDGKSIKYEGEFKDGEALTYNKPPIEKSLMTPVQISNQIINDINRLEGPIYAALLVPKIKLKQLLTYDPPVILLMEDIHAGKQKCSSCNVAKKCYSLYDSSFLNYLNTKAVESKWSIDLFLENWILKNDLKSSKKIPVTGLEYSSLYNMRANVVDCIGARQNKLKPYCNFDNFRTHNTDPRYLYNTQGDKYTGDSLIKRLSYFDKLGKKIKITQIKEFKELLENEFSDFTANDILLVMKKILSNKTPIDFFFDEPFFKKHSRVYHEFNKLPPKLKTTLRTNIKSVYKYTNAEDDEFEQPELDRYFDLFLNTDNYDETQMYYIYPGDLTGNTNFSLSIVDLYTVSRSLKRYENYISQLSVIYQGRDHILSEMKLLKDYYNVVMEFGDNNERNFPLSYSDKCIYDIELTNKLPDTYIKVDNIQEIFKRIIKNKNKNLTDAKINHIISTYPEIRAYIDLRNSISDENYITLESDMKNIYGSIKSIMSGNGDLNKLKTLFDTHDLHKYIPRKDAAEIKTILEIFGHDKELALNVNLDTKQKIDLYILLSILLMTPEYIINNLKKGLTAPISDKRGCFKQDNIIYITRKSPPYPANQCCGQILLGNDKKQYISKPDKNGTCRWVVYKKL